MKLRFALEILEIDINDI